MGWQWGWSAFCFCKEGTQGDADVHDQTMQEDM